MHQIVSVYFPDTELVTTLARRVIQNGSISSFIVQAVKEKLERDKGEQNAMQVQKDDNE